MISVGLAGLVLMGCGTASSVGPLGSSPALTAAQLTPVVVGRVNLGADIADASVRLVSSDGTTLATGTTNANGLVFFHNVLVPNNFRAVATVPGSNEELSAEIQGYSQNNKQAHISLLTTLVSRYLRSHPGLSLPEAENQVRMAVKLPNVVNVEIGPLEPNPFFSDVALWRAAGEAGGWSVFSQQLLNQAELGQGRLYRLSLDQMDRPIHGLERGLSEVAEFARLRLAGRLGVRPAAGAALTRHYVPSITLIEGPSSLGGQLLLGIGTGLGGNLLTAGLNGVVGWAANQLGLNYGTSGQLKEIEQQLDALTTLVQALQTQVTDTTLQTMVDNLNGTFSPVDTANTKFLAQMAAAPSLTDTPFSTPPSFSTLLGDINAPNYPSILSQANTALVGPNQILMLGQQILVNQLLGMDRPDNMQNFPLRNNHILDRLNPLFVYFAGQQTQALNLMAEQAHNFFVNPNPVLGVAGFVPFLNSAASSLKKQRQQLPLYMSQWAPIVDYQNGIMWCETVNNPVDYGDAKSAAESLQIQLIYPDGSTRTYDDWRLPTYGEFVSLQNRGQYNPSYDTTVPVNSHDSYPDTGQATAGLPGLGFYDVASALQAAPNDNGKNGDLWMNYIEFTNGNTYFADNYEFRLNHGTDNTNSENKSSDKNCYVVCRTFGPDVLTYPYAYGYGVEPTSTPDGIGGTPFTAGECAQFGVPTAMTVTTTTASSTVLYPDPVNAGSTRTLTVPSGAVQAVATVTYQINLGGNYTMGYGKTKSFSMPSKSSTAQVKTSDLATGNPNELRELVNWTSSNDSGLRMLNLPYVSGIGIPLATSPVTITASLLGAGGTPVSGSVNYTPPASSPHTLNSIQIMPRNQIYGANTLQPSSGSFPYYCTGFYADGTLETLANQVTWSVPPNAANAQIVVNGSGASLSMAQPPQATPVPYNVVITAAFQGQTDSTTIQIVPPVAAP
ncbi:hypothetical protein IV102_28050 [bacterium]|nr:hypothetical protein [bacterium]